MNDVSKHRVLFVTNAGHISNRPGGVQMCTREYLSLLEAAGFVVELLKVEIDRRWTTRLRRRVRGSPYVGSISQAGLDRIFARASSVDFICLNQVNLAGSLTSDSRAPDLAGKIVLLSHGAEATDLLHQTRELKRHGLPSIRHLSLRNLQAVMKDEILSRAGIEAAVCLSAFDADFERWLGVRCVTWIPRTITNEAIDWDPVVGRFGFLGTLNHVPNLAGLLTLLETETWRKTSDLRIRVVGAPSEVGRWLAASYPRVDYLGELDDQALRDEARTWTAFLNPIFCQARGCSTKLATALGWELPIITTVTGKRGYVDHNDNILAVDDPDVFVEAMVALKERQYSEAVRLRQVETVHTMPSLETNAKHLRSFIFGALKS